MLDVSVTTSVSGAVEIGSSAEGTRAQSTTRPTTTTIDAPTMMAERRSPMSFHPKGSRKNNLAESAALNPTGDLTNVQFPILNSHPKWHLRIENWELSIGQILPSPHSAKLFLRGP